MPQHPDHPVVLLYVHSLLGQGLAQHVRTETGVEVAVAPADDRAAVLAALATDPRVVIFERSAVVNALDLELLAPHAVLIDVSAAVCKGPIPPAPFSPTRADAIVRAVNNRADVPDPRPRPQTRPQHAH